VARVDLDQLSRGQRMVEILKQKQYSPLPFEKQVAIIFAAANAFLDDLPVADVRRFEEQLHAWLDANHPEITGHIRDKGDFPEELEQKLREAVQEFKGGFEPSESVPTPSGQDAEPLTEEEQERLKKFRRPTQDEVRQKAGPAGQGSSGAP